MRITSNTLAITLFIVAKVAVAEQPATEPKGKSSVHREQFLKQAERLSFQGGPTQSEIFERQENPILNWSNPERSTAAGAMFLWTLGDRPEVAACMFPNEEAEPVIELLSLSKAPFVMSFKGQVEWSPSVPGAEFSGFQPIRQASKNRLRRSREMRTISQEFECQVIRTKKPPIPLRLLPTPVYRYPPGVADDETAVVDGALFCYVQGTDPEILLLLEAVEEKDGLEWKFSIGRMTRFQLEVKHGGKLVRKLPWARRDSAPDYRVIK